MTTKFVHCFKVESKCDFRSFFVAGMMVNDGEFTGKYPKIALYIHSMQYVAGTICQRRWPGLANARAGALEHIPVFDSCNMK